VGRSEVFKNIWSVVSMVIDIWSIVLFVLGLGGGGGTVVAALNHIPIYYPVIGGVITLGLIILGIVRIIVRYNKWKAIKNDPLLLNILKTLQELHQRLGELSAIISRRRVGERTLAKAGLHLARLLGINQALGQKPTEQQLDEVLEDFYKRIMKVYKINLKDFSTLTDLMVDVGMTLDKYGIGLSQIRKDDQTYKDLYKCLKDYQLQLNLTDPNNAVWIDKAYEFSFGLQSWSVCASLMEKQKKFREGFPPTYISRMDRGVARFDAAYTYVLLKVKQVIIAELLRGR